MSNASRQPSVWRLSTVSGVLALALGVAAVLAPSPFVVEMPGPVVNTLGEYDGKTIMKVSGKETFPSESELDLTTVSAAGGPGRLILGAETLRGWIDPTFDVVPGEYMYPVGTTSEEQTAQGAQEMVSSQQLAVAAALKELNIPYGYVTKVSGLATDANKAVVQAGDIVTAVNTTKVTDSDTLRKAVKESSGATVRLELKRGDKDLTVSAKVATLDDQGKPSASGTQRSLGLYVTTDFDFPLSVTFGIENIGGPSAGTMLALGLIDQLTPGSLAGKRHVAGTGTITADGTVGPIGGIAQKVVAARDSGATVFLAPAGQNCAELSGRVPSGLAVYSIATLHEARTVVTALADDGDMGQFTRCG